MGHPTLAQRAQAVEDPTSPEIQKVIQKLRAHFDRDPSAGLAAPQINVPLRIFLFQVPEGRCETGNVIPITTVINPEIEYIGEEKELGWERCFSLNDMVGEVPRFKHIKYTYQTLTGETVTQEASGFHARVIQHETDHLDGIMYPQRMIDMSRFGYVEEMKQYIIDS